MTTDPRTHRHEDDEARARALPRTTLLAGVTLLVIGWVFALTAGPRWPTVTRVLVDFGLAAVVAVPILNVAGILAVEWKRRGRVFVIAAAIVLAMLAANALWPA